MVRTSVALRVQKHRQALRKAGLRPVQIWVPARNPNFVEECHRQAKIVAEADLDDSDLLDFLDESLLDIDGWTA